jgi:outer membrane protein
MEEEKTDSTQNIEPIEPIQPIEPIGNTEPLEEALPTPEKPPFFIFNFNTVLGLVVLCGMIVLYFLHFTAGTPTVAPPPLAMQKASGKQLSLVYVNIDSLNSQYEYVKVLRNELEGTGKRMQTEVLSEQAALEKEANEFQRQMAANIIPEEKAKVQYEQLMQKQQMLMEKKERYTQQVAEKEMNMNFRLIDSVTAFLKRYNRTYQFDYIMGYKAGGEILVSNDTLDITRSVLDGLNSEYHQRKK